jgi:transcriptional regulator with XRE-family HTH domain
VKTAADKNLLKAFGKHLASIREKKGISQEALALECGVAQSTIARTENGKLNPSLNNIYIFSKVLDTDLREMMNFNIK